MAGATTRTLRVVIAGNAAGLTGALGVAESGVKKFAAVAAVGIAGTLAAVGKVLVTGFDELKDYQTGVAQLGAGLKSTGNVAGITTDQMEDLASQIEGYSGQTDDSIVKTEQLLLTFTNIRNEAGKNNDVFTQTTKIAADMAARLGGDASTSAIQLGKALNDPVKGITALSKIGVSFTAEQKEQVKAMVASGNTMGAQKLILAELNKEFGGSAKAVGQTLPGQLERAKRQFEGLSQSVATALLPAVNMLLPVLSKAMDWLGPRLTKVTEKAAGGIKKIGQAWTILRGGFTGKGSKIDLGGITGPLDTVGSFFRRAFQTVGPIIQKALGVIRPILAKVMPLLTKLADVFMKDILPVVIELGKMFIEHWVNVITLAAGVVKELLPVLMELVRTLMGAVMPILETLSSVFKEVLAPAISALAKIFVSLLVPIIKIVAQLFKQLLPPLMAIVNVFVKNILPVIIKVVAQVATALVPVLLTLARTIAGILVMAMKQIATFFQQHQAQIVKIVTALGQFLAGALKVADVVLRVLGPIINWVASVVIKGFITYWGYLIGAISAVIDVFRGLGTAIGLAMWAVWQVISTVIEAIKKVFTVGLDVIKTIVSGAWDGIKLVFWSPIKWVYDKIVWFVGQVENWIGKIPGFFSGIWDGLQQGFVDAVNTLIDVYNNTAARIPGVDAIDHMEGPEDKKAGYNKAIDNWKNAHGGKGPTPEQDAKLRKIYGLANGGVITRAGQVMVGERGPEILNLNKGASVVPLPPREGAGGATVIHLTVNGNVHTENDLVEALYRGLLKKQGRNGGRLGLA